MTKPKAPGGATVRESKAAALDEWVKRELTKRRVADAAKMNRLKALRLARDATEPAEIAPDTKPDDPKD
jgi:hypothetical protein